MNTIKNIFFRNANEAYEYLHDQILQHGTDFADTKALFNVGFYITDPMDNKIINRERNWKKDYAEAEWQWYLSGNPYIVEYLKYGNVWLTTLVKLILITAGNGNVKIMLNYHK